MKDEYIIISKTAIQKRIEELEEEQKQINEEKEQISLNINLKKQILIREILSQSTPLIPEVEKLIVMSSISNIDFLPDRVEKIKQDYISNLKLNI